MGCTCACAGAHVSPAVKSKPLSGGGAAAMLSAAPHSCWPSQHKQSAVAPRPGRWSGPTPPPHPLGQLPADPGARYQASAGRTPDSSCRLALGLPPSLSTGAGAAWAAGLGAQLLSTHRHLPLRPLGCGPGREAGHPIQVPCFTKLPKASKFAPGPFP